MGRGGRKSEGSSFVPKVIDSETEQILIVRLHQFFSLKYLVKALIELNAALCCIELGAESFEFAVKGPFLTLLTCSFPAPFS